MSSPEMQTLLALPEFIARHECVTVGADHSSFTVVFPGTEESVTFQYDPERGLKGRGKVLRELNISFRSLRELSHYIRERKMLLTLCGKYPGLEYVTDDGDHRFLVQFADDTTACFRLRFDGSLVVVKELGGVKFRPLDENTYTVAEMLQAAGEAGIKEMSGETRAAASVIRVIDATEVSELPDEMPDFFEWIDALSRQNPHVVMMDIIEGEDLALLYSPETDLMRWYREEETPDGLRLINIYDDSEVKTRAEFEGTVGFEMRQAEVVGIARTVRHKLDEIRGSDMTTDV